MTSYNCCAYPGCYVKIPYEIGDTPEKYCEKHLGRNRSNLFTTPLPVATTPMVTFRCNECHAKRDIDRELWMGGAVPLCCEQKMVFHKETVKLSVG